MLKWFAALVFAAASPALAEEAPPPATTTPAAAPAEAKPAPDAKPAEGEALNDWTNLRIDIEDGFALHPWIYHEFRVSEHWGILASLHAQSPGLSKRWTAFAELDIGPNVHLGPFQINPQVGMDLGWKTDDSNSSGGYTKASDIIPQLYVLFSMGRVNAEFWNMYYFPLSGDPQFYIGRLLANVRIVGGLAIGPHMEWTWVQYKGQDRLAFGGDLINTFRWGQVGLYVGYDRKNETPEFRLTFQREL
jgi:hypothetical protein